MMVSNTNVTLTSQVNTGTNVALMFGKEHEEMNELCLFTCHTLTEYSAIKLQYGYAEQAHRNHESFRSLNRTKEPVRKALKGRGKLRSEASKSRVACSNKTWKSLLMLYQPESPLGSVGLREMTSERDGEKNICPDERAFVWTGASLRREQGSQTSPDLTAGYVGAVTSSRPLKHLTTCLQSCIYTFAVYSYRA
ncbi:hypothetical protein IRJ41_013350 [Triplophysa rosa]|uniref:Uncharacterized protein n=1 Tax=Triplophysa rosa TaxID=992332 RepID=A0A9W8C607_TRIRA|nr:hypothetical protein IRJ41_013350 [Triplophysa rosa]